MNKTFRPDIVEVPFESSALGRQTEVLRQIAENTESLENLKRLAATAEQQAVEAKKDARFARILAILSLCVSVGSLVLPYLFSFLR